MTELLDTASGLLGLIIVADVADKVLDKKKKGKPLSKQKKIIKW